nr:PREDICTED: uncharacterized protein LOC107801029 [Nicotiana tabacum]
MAESTELKRQNLEGGGGSEPPSSASEPPSLTEKSKNGFEPPSSSPEKGGQNPEACWLNPHDACEEHVPDFFKIWMNYRRQTYDSNGFDCDYYPCSSFGTLLYPVINPNTAEAELMMELANLAIQEYNEKECNVCIER